MPETQTAEDVCTKVTYGSLGAAAAEIRKLHRKGRKGLRAYRCPRCERWHLTGMDPDSQARNLRVNMGGRVA